MSFMSQELNRRGKTELLSHPGGGGGSSVTACPLPCSRQLRGRAASSLAGWEFNLGILHS